MSSIHTYRTGPIIQTQEKGRLGQALFAITNDSVADTLEVLGINATPLTLTVMNYLAAPTFNILSNATGNLALRRITTTTHVGGEEVAAVEHDTNSALASGIKLMLLGDRCEYGDYLRRVQPRVGLLATWTGTTPSSTNLDMSGCQRCADSGAFDHNLLFYSFDATVNGAVPLSLREGEGLALVPDDHMEPGYWRLSVTVRQRTAGGTFTYTAYVTTNGHQQPVFALLNDSSEVSPEIVEVVNVSLGLIATQFNTTGASANQPVMGAMMLPGVAEGTVLTATRFDTAETLPGTVVARKEAVPIYPGGMSPSVHDRYVTMASFGGSGALQVGFMAALYPVLFAKPVVLGYPYSTREQPNQRVYDPVWRATPNGPKLLVLPGQTLALVAPMLMNASAGAFFSVGWPQPRCNVDVEVTVKYTAYVAPPSGGATDYAFVG